MNYYNEIKEELINNEITKRVKDYSKNKSDLETYYKVGKMLSEAGKCYGDMIISEYSKRLSEEIGKKYSVTTLKYIRQFYVFSKSHSLSDKLTFTHYKMLFPLKNKNEINYYIKLAQFQNLSVRELKEKIKNKEYERIPEDTKQKLIDKENETITDYIKNPIIINNKINVERITEKVLQKLILEDIAIFLKELGKGFTFIENEYKIKIGNSYNYIDLLLYNIEYVM